MTPPLSENTSPSPSTLVSVEEWTEKRWVALSDGNVTWIREESGKIICEGLYGRPARVILDVLRDAHNASLASLTAALSSLLASLAVSERDREEAAKAIQGLLQHAGIADQHAEDIDAEDHQSESFARKVLVSLLKHGSGITDAP